MRRIIVDYSKLNNDILDLLVEKFPDGYDREDIIVFKNANNESIEAVEVKTEDTIYLVKVSRRLSTTMEDYSDEEAGEEEEMDEMPESIEEEDF